MTVDTPGPTGVVTGSRHHQQQPPSYSRSHHPSAMHEKQPSESYSIRQDDDDDDNVCVAQLLNAKAKNASPRPSRSNTMRGYRSRDRSPVPNVSTLQRSASSGGASRRHMNHPSNEPPVPPLPTQQHQQANVDKDDEDLRAAVQCAWAVLESGNNDGAEKKQLPATVAMDSPTPAPTTATVNHATYNRSMVRTLTIRIYINDGSTHKTVQLTNLLTTAMVLQYLKKKGLLDNTDDWAMFEICNSYGLERPLRQWEVVMDSVSTWDPEMNSYLLVKKYKYCDSLIADSVLQKLYPPHYGWLNIEYKKGKWHKRFCFIMDNAIHHSKDSKGTNAVVLCQLSTFDVYTMLHPFRDAPTEYVFALRAQEKPRVFERSEDYMKMFSAEDADSLREWVLSIRCSKSAVYYQQHPNRVTNPLMPVDLNRNDSPTSRNDASDISSRGGTLRRHKSTRDMTSSYNNDEELNRKYPGPIENGRSTLSRHSSRRRIPDNPLIDCTDRETFAKGSLLAQSNQDESNYQQQQQQQQIPPPLPQQQAMTQPIPDDNGGGSTLIQLQDKTPFAKGSLLAKKNGIEQQQHVSSKLSRSKSTRDTTTHYQDDQPAPARRHVSLRRKPTSSRDKARWQQPDAPMPAMPTMPSNGPLLNLEDPEQIHSRQLMERQIKPLVNFATSDPRGRR
ncbi:hypothetical protein K492DRAFT_154171 [Lichtheimia hyalospora FSU 10163]|nr:hypothetical protein K492DRAFT_154171 [Lichtheimia hyalospora FSU 10163]